MEELLQQIALSDFGETARAVVGAVQTHGAISLKEIVDATKLNVFDVKNILVVLIKHNCIGIKTKQSEDLEDDDAFGGKLYLWVVVDSPFWVM